MAIGAVNVAQSNSATASVTINSQASGSSFSLLVTWQASENYSSGPTDTIGGGASGNTWTQVGSEVSSLGGLSDSRLYYVSGGFNGGTTHQFSVTFNASTFWTISVVEVTGVDTTTPVTGTPVFSSDTASPFASSSVTTTAANATLVSQIHNNASSGSQTFNADSSASPTSGWTVQTGATYSSAATNWIVSQKTQVVTSTGTYNGAWTVTSGGTASAVGLIAFRDAPTGSVDQQAFRFGSDDGSESAHNWLATQNTNITQSLASSFLLRFLLQATGDPGATAFTLRAQKNGAGGYSVVPVGANSSPTLSYGEAGAWAYSAVDGTSVAPSYPANITVNSGLALVVYQKPNTANGGTCTTPSGWTLVGSITGGNDGNTGGYTTTLGADTGNMNIYVYTKDTVSGTESGKLTVTVSDNEICGAAIIRLQASDTATWSWAIATGKDTSAGNVSIATGNLAITSGDVVIGGMAIPTDVTTPSQFSAHALSQTGTTFGTVSEISEADTTTGNDMGGYLIQAAVSSGSGSGAVTMTATAGGTTTNVRGPGFVLRARVASVARELYVATSSNIAAGGEATTSRLTGGTGSFTTGRRWDDENGTDTIDPVANNNTEVEWSLNTQLPAVNGDYWDLRVYAGSAALTTYDVTPRITLGSGTTSRYPRPYRSSASNLAVLMSF